MKKLPALIAVVFTTASIAAFAQATPATPAKPADPAKPAEPPKPADPAAAGPGINPELETKVVTAMTRMGDIFAADAKDCEKLAVDVKAFVTENKDMFAQMKVIQKTLTPDQIAGFESRHKGMQESMMAKMDPATKACADNKNVQAAMAVLEAD